MARSTTPTRRFFLALILLLASATTNALAQSSPSLAWDEDPSSHTTGFAVTIDGVRADYGVAPEQPDGTCSCSVPLPFSSGRHSVVVSAYNESGEAASAVLIVGPTANAGGPYSGQAGVALSVSGASSIDATGAITGYVWHWGDGAADTSSSSPTASHTYATTGVFTITLTVADDFPASHSTTTTATIGAAPPPPPDVPSAPTPSNSATGVSGTPTLTWSATNATSYDVSFGLTNPPPSVATAQAAASYTPAALTANATYYWQIVAHNNAGTTQGPIWSFTTAPLPMTPSAPTPVDGATGVSGTPTLTWSATNATSYDVSFGLTNPPPSVTTAQAAASYTPAPLTANATYYWQIVAHNNAGTTQGPIWSFTTATAAASTDDIVIYAADIATTALHGMWSQGNDPTSPGGIKLTTPDTGWSLTNAPDATPAHYVDIPFSAVAGTPYTIWLRLQALANSKWNDSLWVQLSDAQANGAPVYPIGTTSALLVNLATDSTGSSDQGWGWQNSAYWFAQPTTVTFATGGTHTLRVQVREDGVAFDQVVLSPSTYRDVPPGSVSNDSTIVPKP